MTKTVTRIDLNADLGEAYGAWRMGDDAALLGVVSSANIACGYHGGDPDIMRATVALALRHGVAIGAHVSLPDLQGFGRREMKMPRDELANCIIYQVGALKGFLDAEGMALNHLKPHGSLYGMAAREEAVAHAICDAADVFKLPIMGIIGTCHETVYAARGHNFLRTMLRLAHDRHEVRVVNDQRGAPTTARLIADVTAQVLARWLAADAKRREDLNGTYHLSAAGECTWHEFARWIFIFAHNAGLIDKQMQVAPIATSDYPTKAMRPAYSVLDCAKLRETFGIHLPLWQQGLDSVIAELASAAAR